METRIDIQILYNRGFACNTYIITCRDLFVIIDPSLKVSDLKHFLKTKKLAGVIITHGHFDHFMTLNEIVKCENTICYLHKRALKKLADPYLNGSASFGYQIKSDLENYQIVNDGDTIKISDELSFKVLYTPGHTDCSICLQLGNHLFTGDTLFKNGIGRSDLPTGDFRILKQSLMRLASLSGLTVYPGHDEITTIEEERKKILKDT